MAPVCVWCARPISTDVSPVRMAGDSLHPAPCARELETELWGAPLGADDGADDVASAPADDSPYYRCEVCGEATESAYTGDCENPACPRRAACAQLDEPGAEREPEGAPALPEALAEALRGARFTLTPAGRAAVGLPLARGVA
jgi:hypothetical protein